MNTAELAVLAAEARVHSDNLFADIRNAKDRFEHIRLSVLAIEAQHLALVLTDLETRSRAQDADAVAL